MLLDNVASTDYTCDKLKVNYMHLGELPLHVESGLAMERSSHVNLLFYPELVYCGCLKV